MIALRNWQTNRRQESIKAVKDAIKALLEEGVEVSFSSVAKRSGVTRKTLYTVSELKQLVLEHREESDLSLEQSKKIAELESEVKRLKDALFAIRAILPVEKIDVS